MSILHTLVKKMPILSEHQSSAQIEITKIHSFFCKHVGKLALNSICLGFSQFEPEIMIKVCLISKLTSWPQTVLDVKTAIVSLNCLNLDIQLALT